MENVVDFLGRPDRFSKQFLKKQVKKRFPR